MMARPLRRSVPISFLALNSLLSLLVFSGDLVAAPRHASPRPMAVIRFQPSMGAASVRALIKQNRIELVKKLEAVPGTYIVRLPAQTSLSKLSSLIPKSSVVYIEPLFDGKVKFPIDECPNCATQDAQNNSDYDRLLGLIDPVRSNLSFGANCRKQLFNFSDDSQDIGDWDDLITGNDFVLSEIKGIIPKDSHIIVADVDSGLNSNQIPQAPGHDVHSDVIGHGTHVAGIIAKSNPYAELNMQVVGDAGDTTGNQSGDTLTDLSRIIADGKTKVVNLSLAGEIFHENGQALQDLIAAGNAKGMVFVKAMGNDSQESTENEFLALPGVISVGSTNASQTKSFFSTYGSRVDLAAPGTDILSDYSKNTDGADFLGYPTFDISQGRRGVFASGTSMAAPEVAAAVSLLKLLLPDFNATQIKSILTSTATPLKSETRFTVGSGNLNSYRAFRFAAYLKSHPDEAKNLEKAYVSFLPSLLKESAAIDKEVLTDFPKTAVAVESLGCEDLKKLISKIRKSLLLNPAQPKLQDILSELWQKLELYNLSLGAKLQYAPREVDLNQLTNQMISTFTPHSYQTADSMLALARNRGTALAPWEDKLKTIERPNWTAYFADEISNERTAHSLKLSEAAGRKILNSIDEAASNDQWIPRNLPPMSEIGEVNDADKLALLKNPAVYGSEYLGTTWSIITTLLKSKTEYYKNRDQVETALMNVMSSGGLNLASADLDPRLQDLLGRDPSPKFQAFLKDYLAKPYTSPEISVGLEGILARTGKSDTFDDLMKLKPKLKTMNSTNDISFLISLSYYPNQETEAVWKDALSKPVKDDFWDAIGLTDEDGRDALVRVMNSDLIAEIPAAVKKIENPESPTGSVFSEETSLKFLLDALARTSNQDAVEAFKKIDLGPFNIQHLEDPAAILTIAKIKAKLLSPGDWMQWLSSLNASLQKSFASAYFKKLTGDGDASEMHDNLPFVKAWLHSKLSKEMEDYADALVAIAKARDPAVNQEAGFIFDQIKIAHDLLPADSSDSGSIYESFMASLLHEVNAGEIKLDTSLTAKITANLATMSPQAVLYSRQVLGQVNASKKTTP